MNETASYPVNETSREDVNVLMTRVAGLAARRKQRAWLIPILLFIAFIAALIGLGASGHLETGWPALGAFALLFGPGLWMWARVERSEIRSLENLAACKDLRAVGSLLESVNCGGSRVRNTVQAALVDLLPRMTEEYSPLLNTDQREVLNALLYGKSGELAFAALTAIEQVGDGTALPYLTSIAAGKGVPGTLRNRKTEVQERARCIVQVIHERIERHNRANVLLRASQVPIASSDQLVRPAHSQSRDDGQELLRPEASAKQDMEKN